MKTVRFHFGLSAVWLLLFISTFVRAYFNKVGQFWTIPVVIWTVLTGLLTAVSAVVASRYYSEFKKPK